MFSLFKPKASTTEYCSEAQIDYIMNLSQEIGEDFDEITVAHWTKAEASIVIDQLKADWDEMYNND